MPENRFAPGSPQEWLARAKGDLALAGAPLPPGAFYEDLCFHAQQAAEKALKATYLDRVCASQRNLSSDTVTPIISR